jgi:two-component system, cell cycle response regulator
VTFRARLTGAFLAVVMGPVLVGGVFVGITVNAINHSHERDRLNLAVNTTRTMIAAACDRLQTTAEAAATTTVAGTRPTLAQSLVTAGRASAIHIENAAGFTLVTTPNAPSAPWALCTPLPASSGIPAYDPSVDGPYTALASVVVMTNQLGQPAGYAYAIQTLTPAFVKQMSASTGVQTTIMSLGTPSVSTQSAAAAKHIAKFAAGLSRGSIGEDRGRYVRRMDPAGEQPFTIGMSVPVTPSGGLVAIVIAVATFAALAAIVAAWALARTTTKPLDEIAEAAGRIADGDLGTRVPVRHDDEVGHVGAAFNRLSRDMQSYATALTNSRDQLRGNLDMIGDTLASTHDLPRILRVILASAISATGAQAGVVLLADPSGSELRVQCEQGFDEPSAQDLAALVLTPGEGLLGSVAATGVARRGHPDDAAGPAPLPHEPTCRTFLAVPLRSPVAPPTAIAGVAGVVGVAGTVGAVGVLALYDRLGDDDFDDTDLRTVRSFAGHASIAVDNVRAHDEAQRLSHTDPLTGLYNYRHLKDLLRRETNRSTRFGHPLCVMVMDLDRFKEVNDTYGHAAGDAVLMEFASRIGVEIRGVDLAFRYGGEEFVLLLPETDGIGGITLAQRLGAAVRDAPFTIPGGRSEAGTRTTESTASETVAVTVSIGVAVFPEHGMDGTQVVESADDALYAAKAAGRDTYRLAVSRVAATPVIDASFTSLERHEGRFDHAPTQVVPSQPAAEAPVVRDEETAPAGIGGPSGFSGFGRWRNRGSGRAGGRLSGGAPGSPPPPRQSRGR